MWWLVSVAHGVRRRVGLVICVFLLLDITLYVLSTWHFIINSVHLIFFWRQEIIIVLIRTSLILQLPNKNIEIKIYDIMLDCKLTISSALHPSLSLHTTFNYMIITTHKFVVLTFLLNIQLHLCQCWHISLISYFLFHIYYRFYTYKFLLCKHFGIPNMCTAT